MEHTHTLPRLVVDSLKSRLQVMPAVVVTGARQTGKSTLTQELTPERRRFLSLDELDVLGAARRDPEALLGGNEPVTIDEVQREPDFLLAVKRAIDRERQPGKFLITGSANLLLMRRVSESLAGRASYITLWPMTRREEAGLGRGGAWEELLEARDEDWPDLLASQSSAHEDWRDVARRGGFPFPAAHLKSAEERAVWFEGYERTYLERDLQEVSSIAALPDFRRVMRGACLRLGQLMNQAGLSRDVALKQTTVHRYLNLLETSYMLVRLPAYAVNRTKRLVKSPKTYWADTGLALYLAQETEPRGAHLENIVLHDLLAWRDARLARAEIFYWRTTVGEEVDFVIEAGERLLPIEVKATGRPRFQDTANLRSFRSEYGETSRAGLLLHDGETLEWLAPGVLAAPWWKVL